MLQTNVPIVLIVWRESIHWIFSICVALGHAAIEFKAPTEAARQAVGSRIGYFLYQKPLEVHILQGVRCFGIQSPCFTSASIFVVLDVSEVLLILKGIVQKKISFVKSHILGYDEVW